MSARRAAPHPQAGERSLRVGIVGCGQVAKHHLRFIAETKTAQIVGLADKDPAQAARLAASQGSLVNICGSLEELLDSTPLDVIHILTPPAYHHGQAATAIERGVHVLLEKPCVLAARDAEDLYRRAAARGVSICPDFIHLFNPAFQRARAVIDSGRLGRVVHIESHLSVDLNTPELREGVGLHWSYGLPGGVLHNQLTHPLYMTLHWLGRARVVAVSAQSRGILPQGLTDHLHVSLEGERGTAAVVLSAAIQPPPYYLKVFCEQGIVTVDFDTFTVLVTRKSALPRSVTRATSNFAVAYQLASRGVGNVFDFVRRKLVPYPGLRGLIPAFYHSIQNGTEPPISRDLTLAVAEVEEAIVAQMGRSRLETSGRPSRQAGITRPERVLVTGATGYLGTEVVRQLVEAGYYVRALVRGLSRTETLERLGVELVYGDVRELDSVIKAAEGMDVIVHLAAGLRGTPGFIVDCCVEGTKNVLEAAQKQEVSRGIYLSSMTVYDFSRLRDGDVITDESPLEERPESRGTYSLAKRRAEDVMLDALKDGNTAWTILRPSVVVGRGGDLFQPLGVKAGNILVCFGAAGKRLRVVHVDDVAAAITALVRSAGTRGRIYTLSDHGSLTLREYVDGCVRAERQRGLRVLYFPHWLAACGVAALAALRKLTGKGPNMNMRRLAYLYRDVTVDSRPIYADTGWCPPGDLVQRLKRESDRATP